jgi:phage terminase small subunit
MKTRKGQLTQRQRLFCEHYVGAGNHNAALSARMAGYAPGCSQVTGCQLLQLPKVAATVRDLQLEATKQLAISRQDVVHGLAEAFDTAKDSNDPGAMISAMKSLAWILGFDKPDPQAVQVQNEAHRARQRALQAKFDALSDQELMALVEG